MIVVIGDSILDKYTYVKLIKFSPEAPVAVVEPIDLEYRLGGASNVLANLVSLNTTNIGFITSIGKDSYGDILYNKLKELDISIEVTWAKNTVVKERIVNHNHQMLRIDTESEGFINSEDTVLLENAEIVVISEYNKTPISDNLICIAKSKNIPIIVDTKNWRDIYKGIHTITPNEIELEGMIGKWSSEANLISKSKEFIYKYNIGNLLITRSEKGVTLVNTNGVTNYPATAKQVADVTGAGDTLVSVYSLLIHKGYYPEGAARIANFAAGIKVSKFGTYAVKYEEIFI